MKVMKLPMHLKTESTYWGVIFDYSFLSSAFSASYFVTHLAISDWFAILMYYAINSKIK